MVQLILRRQTYHIAISSRNFCQAKLEQRISAAYRLGHVIGLYSLRRWNAVFDLQTMVHDWCADAR